MSSLIKVHQNTPSSVNYEVTWKFQITQSNMKYTYLKTMYAFNLDISGATWLGADFVLRRSVAGCSKVRQCYLPVESLSSG